mmetsp:Transcript_30638/g.70142  ORF Transcript_30638/g.70142 Transcript_30638/m.70142 type:complete len:845 (-) Transcript_30638:341-2875(-)
MSVASKKSFEMRRVRHPRLDYMSEVEACEIPKQISLQGGGVHVYHLGTDGKWKPKKLAFTSDNQNMILFKSDPASQHHIGKTKSKPQWVHVSCIDYIKRGVYTDKFEKQMVTDANLADQLETTLSIVYLDGLTIDLWFVTYRELELFYNTSVTLLSTYDQTKNSTLPEVILLHQFWLDFANAKGNLELLKVKPLFAQINVKVTYSEVYSMARHLPSFDEKRGLSISECAYVIYLVKARNNRILGKKPLISELWKSLQLMKDHDHPLQGSNEKTQKHKKSLMSASTFWWFLTEIQGEKDFTFEDSINIITYFNSMCGRERNGAEYMDKETFELYLTSTTNDAFDPDKSSTESCDMTQPLSSYWINSSHNTYLKGSQFASKASVNMYIDALDRGCRCLEIDCWDNVAPETEPVVTHGYTLTSTVLFMDVVQAIKFFIKCSPQTYPIILSIEDHCSNSSKEKMAHHMKNIFQDSLYVIGENVDDLPSPESLRGKVIIKGKRPPNIYDREDNRDDIVQGNKAFSFDDDDDCDNEGYNAVKFENSERSNLPLKFVTTNSLKKTLQQVGPAKSYIKHVGPQLAQITSLNGIKLENFGLSLKQDVVHMHSVSERKLKRIVKKGQRYWNAWMRYNEHHMTRIYPSGTRLDSSNFNPLIPWSMGCQLVSLNFQTKDDFLFVNDGRFRENGNCGYVLKPDVLIARDEDDIVPVKLRIQVLWGSLIPKRSRRDKCNAVDPFVKVSVYDGVQGQNVQSFKTQSVLNNGLNPVWNNEIMEFVISNPEIAVILFGVWDNGGNIAVYGDLKSHMIGFSAIPFSCLREGYRSVALYDKNNTRDGTFCVASVVVQISKILS